MSHTVTSARRSDPVRSLDNIGPASDQIGPGQAKAGVRSGLSWNATMRDGIIAHYGSVKEAAYALGKVDPSLMMREFKNGEFARFDKHADELAKAGVAVYVLDVFGALSTPLARSEKLLSDIENNVRELRQLLLYVLERPA